MRKPKPEKKKISINRETLRRLVPDRLDGVAGGATLTCATCFSRCGQHSCLTCTNCAATVCHTC